MDVMAVLERIAVPRPNHSETLERTASYRLYSQTGSIFWNNSRISSFTA